MRIIRPTVISDAMLISSNVAETDYTAWSGATTYALGDRAISTTTHKIYESIQAGNLNHDPVADTALATPLWWKVVSATGRWQMFDGLAGAQTSHATSINVEIAPGRIDSAALINLDAESVTLELVDGATTIYSTTVSLALDNVFDWYEYFFEPIIRKTDVAITDIPVFGSAHLLVTINGGTGTAKCGELIVGMYRDLGITLQAPKAGIIDFSRKEIDEFGNPQITQRRFSKRLSCDLFVENRLTDEVHRLLSEFRSTPLVWIGSKDYASTIIFGFYKDFDIIISGRWGSKCDLQIEGLI
ncbi:MAG: hypothetical protein K8H84_11010 [Sulfuricella denitrificans]|nr:hypothetical protein [Sulfuricella denitrificans]